MGIELKLLSIAPCAPNKIDCKHQMLLDKSSKYEMGWGGGAAYKERHIHTHLIYLFSSFAKTPNCIFFRYFEKSKKKKEERLN